MNKNCIINLSVNSWYARGQARLKQSLDKYFDGDVLLYTDESQVGSPIHKNNPYAFKPYCFYDALNKGYENIFWLDSSVWVVKDLKPIFDILDKEKYLFLSTGFSISQYTNDNCLNYFNKTRQYCSDKVMFMSGIMGLNIKDERSNLFLQKWKQAADNGAFIGSWDNHRHCQSCGSVIADELGMKVTINTHDYASYIGDVYGQPKQTSFFYLQGM